MVDLKELKQGDRVRVTFDPPRREDGQEITVGEGELQVVAGLHFLLDELHRRAWSAPTPLNLDAADVKRVELLQDRAAVQAERQARRRGAIVLPSMARTSVELREDLDQLAALICEAPDRGIHSRKEQLTLQFDDVADLVALAQSKRTYIITRARLGRDFHPWEERDPRVHRISTVRPLPADFEFDRDLRMDRSARLDQSIKIFGEAERETRRYLSCFRAAGFDARRPHPNAQEIRLRYREGRRAVDLGVAPGRNGLWSVRQLAMENKTKSRVLQRVLRRGEFQRAAEALDSFMQVDV